VGNPLSLVVRVEALRLGPQRRLLLRVEALRLGPQRWLVPEPPQELRRVWLQWREELLQDRYYPLEQRFPRRSDRTPLPWQGAPTFLYVFA